MKNSKYDPDIAPEILEAYNQKMLLRCKVYDPSIGGRHWANENSHDHATRITWGFEYGLCHADEHDFSLYKGDLNDIEAMAEWSYEIFLRGLHGRIGDKDFEKYLKMPFKIYRENPILDPADN